MEPSLVVKEYVAPSPDPPRITHLGFTYGHMSSTLACISTGSPATTVTWMRDGQPLTIDGRTYFLTHTVNYGRSSTYENVLTINAAVSSIYRHAYTCTVVNALGTASEILTASKTIGLCSNLSTRIYNTRHHSYGYYYGLRPIEVNIFKTSFV